MTVHNPLTHFRPPLVMSKLPTDHRVLRLQRAVVKTRRQMVTVCTIEADVV
ncbi:hypothetical protein F2Q69_00041972 [Brassica cretica]|uniref:Uncharacterized protein n=1 Tax=Brassica cretica TaxID=69181 RepID=A0A8S9NPJ6_BRACR|nr:hypothetical protein F2Q69_00041972 [Brassica cretica]